MAKQYDDKLDYKSRDRGNVTNINDTTQDEEQDDLEQDEYEPVTNEDVATKASSQAATAVAPAETKKEETTAITDATATTEKPKVEALRMSEFDKSIIEVNEILGIAGMDGGRDRKDLPAVELPTIDELNAKDKEPAATTETATTETATDTANASDTAPKTSGRIALGGLATAGEAVKKDPLVETKKAAQEQGRLFGLSIGTAQGQGQATPEAGQEALAAQLGTKGTEKPALSDMPVLSTVQAAEHYPSDFENGYTRGFNQGYAIGMEALREKERQDKAKAQGDIKKSAAYIAGQLAGTNQATNPCDATKAATATEEEKFANLPAEGTATVSPATAFSMGFNAGYGEGLGKKQQAAADAANAEKTDPKYIQGEELAKKAVAEPENASKYEAEANATGEKLTQKGYLVGFNKAYAIKLGADQAAKASLSDPKAVAQGEFKPFFDNGEAAAKAGQAGSFDKSALPPVANESEADKKSRENKAEAAYTMGYNKGLFDKAKAANSDTDENGKKIDKNPVKFRHGEAVGKVIGILTTQGGDESIAKNEKLKALLAGQTLPTNEGQEANALTTAPTLDKLKAYLSGLEFMVGPKTRPELPKEGSIESAELPTAERTRIMEEQAAFDALENLGTAEDFERGYTRGFNQGYGKGLGKQQSDKDNTQQNAAKNDPEFKAGYEDGQAVGQLAAQTSQKAGTPETKAAFDAELSNVQAQAKAQGGMYYTGYTQGFNAAYAVVLGGGEVAKKEALPNSIEAIVAAYEKVGDSDMAERITKQYESSQAEAYKDVYEQLTAPYSPEKKEEGQKFATLPTAADLAQKRIEATSNKLGDVKKSYAAEIKTYQKLEAAGNADQATKAKNTLAAIDKEIKVLTFAAEKAYENAYAAAQNDGYSFIEGFDAQIALQRGDAADENAAENKSTYVVPKPEKANSKEAAKGAQAAKLFENAMLLSKALTTPDKDGKVYKNPKGMSLPPIVVSSAYKQGYEEAQQKWSIVKLVQAGIPIPTKLKGGDMYKAYYAEKEDDTATTEELTTAPATNDKPATTPEKTEPKIVALTRATYGANPYYIPEKAYDANTLMTVASAITTTDIEFFQAELVASYYEKVLAAQSARSADKEDDTKTKLDEVEKKFKAADSKTIVAIKTTYFDALRARANTVLKDKEDKPTKLAKLDAAIKTADATLVEAIDASKLDTARKALADVTQNIVNPDADKLTELKGKLLAARQADLDTLLTQVYGTAAAEEKQKIDNSIKAAKRDFLKGYVTAKKQVDSNDTSTDEDDETKFTTYLADYAKEIGYCHSFVENVAQLGLQNNTPAKALRLIQQFVSQTQANIPVETVKHILAITSYTTTDVFKIECTEDCKTYLQQNPLAKDIYNEAYAAHAQIGKKDASAAYNLSTDAFSFTSGTLFRAENSNEIAPIGPLGQLVAKTFKKILPLATSMNLPPELTAQTESLKRQLNTANSMADLNKTKTPYAKFRDDLFGKNAQLESTFTEKMLKFEPTKKVEYTAADKLIFMDFARADKPQLDAKKLIFSLGSEAKTNSGSDKIRLVSDTKALFTISGGGLNYLLGKNAPDIFAPRIIIPTLQKQLIAENPADKTKKVTLPEGFITEHLRIGEGAIKLDAENMKNTITQLRNNVISALNKKEAADYEKSTTPKINPNPPA